MRPAALAAALLLAPCVANAAEWEVIPGESAVTFRYTEDGRPRDGRFPAFDARIAFDPDRPAAAELLFDVETARIDLGDALREGVLLTSPWFDAQSHPRARFELTRLLPVGPGWRAEGALTIKDRTLPVAFPVVIETTGGRGRARGTLTVDRGAFALRDAALEAFVTIGEEVEIAFDIAARHGGDGS